MVTYAFTDNNRCLRTRCGVCDWWPDGLDIRVPVHGHDLVLLKNCLPRDRPSDPAVYSDDTSAQSLAKHIDFQVPLTTSKYYIIFIIVILISSPAFGPSIAITLMTPPGLHQ